MEPILVACGCGARVKVPGTVASKRIRCPKCSAALDVPEAAPPKPTLQSFGGGPPAAPRAPAPATKDCGYCGEAVLASAKKCKHCGEFFDSADDAASASAPTPSRRSSPSSPPKRTAPNLDPNPAEYFAAIALAPVGLVIGGVWAVKGLPKSKKMLQVAATMCVIYCVAGYVIWAYALREAEPQGAFVTNEQIERGQQDLQGRIFVLPPGSIPDGGILDQEQQQGGRSGLPGGAGGVVDLEGQPPLIQKAMRANVLIQVGGSSGSGVVIQRSGDEVWILTNRHVVDSAFAQTHGQRSTDLKDMPKLKITYFDQMSNDGVATWVAPNKIDLAIVKATAPKEIEPVLWQGLPKVIPGQTVFAVGNPLGLGWTFTRGAVSALRKEKFAGETTSREVPFIQTDTSITYGNSGGGLYSEDGQLIGINSSIANPAAGGGVGFAIRVSVLVDLKPDGITLPTPGEGK